jgi:hypothetical protein
VHQVGHYPESHQDARSTKHKKIARVICMDMQAATSGLMMKE